MKIKIKQIKIMVKEAVRIGNIVKDSLRLAEFYDHIEDGGTSNLDSCLVEFENSSKKFIEIVNEVSGGNVKSSSKSYHWIAINDGSQGYKRTKKAEVVCDYLKSHGINAHVEYNLD